MLIGYFSTLRPQTIGLYSGSSLFSLRSGFKVTQSLTSEISPKVRPPFVIRKRSRLSSTVKSRSLGEKYSFFNSGFTSFFFYVSDNESIDNELFRFKKLSSPFFNRHSDGKFFVFCSVKQKHFLVCCWLNESHYADLKGRTVLVQDFSIPTIHLHILW